MSTVRAVLTRAGVLHEAQATLAAVVTLRDATGRADQADLGQDRGGYVHLSRVKRHGYVASAASTVSTAPTTTTTTTRCAPVLMTVPWKCDESVVLALSAPDTACAKETTCRRGRRVAAATPRRQESVEEGVVWAAEKILYFPGSNRGALKHMVKPKKFLADLGWGGCYPRGGGRGAVATLTSTPLITSSTSDTSHPHARHPGRPPCR